MNSCFAKGLVGHLITLRFVPHSRFIRLPLRAVTFQYLSMLLPRQTSYAINVEADLRTNIAPHSMEYLRAWGLLCTVWLTGRPLPRMPSGGPWTGMELRTG